MMKFTRNPLVASSLALAMLSPALASADNHADPLAPAGKWTAPVYSALKTPPMGWNTWNAFATEIDEQKVMGSAQAMIDTGLSKLGYVYVNLDDGWWARRRASDGRMQVRADAFPSAANAGAAGTSLKPFVDKLHRLGLKAGLYSDIGRNTCSQVYSPLGTAGLPVGTMAEREVGLYGHIDADIRTYFKDWGFDYIKVDACGLADYSERQERVQAGHYRQFDPILFRGRPTLNQNERIRGLYEEVGSALAKYRPEQDYVLSICSWGQGDSRKWGKTVGNTWRTSDDLYPKWERMLHTYDSTATRAMYSRPGAWNDPDMLYIGAGDFDINHLTEARSHFNLWAMVNAPLLLGYDLRKAPKALSDIWSNADVIALNQDPLGNQAVLAYRSNDIHILVKSLAGGKKAATLFNRTGNPFTVTLTAAQLKMAADAPVILRDLWSKQTLAPFTGQVKITLAPHESRVFMVEGKRVLADGLYLSEMTGQINVAEDGIRVPEPDPELYRASSWGKTLTAGEWPTYTGWGGAQADASPYSTGLAIGARSFNYGVGILADSRLEVKTAGKFNKFSAEVGVDNATRDRKSSVQFLIYGDGKLLARSKQVKFGDTPVAIEANTHGVAVLELIVRRTEGSGDVAVVWGDARLTDGNNSVATR